MGTPDKKQKFAHATEVDGAAGLAKLLEELAAGVRSGELALEHGARGIVLRPSGAVAVSIEAKHRTQRESLQLSVEWTPAPDEPVLRVGPASERPARPGPAAEPAPEPAPAPASPAEDPDPAAVVLDEELLARLPKERLYALARAVELDGRSQLPKRALARALAGHELHPHLSAADLGLLADPD